MNGEDAMAWLARFLSGLSAGGGESPMLGTVLSPDPLTVLCGGVPQESGALLMDALLLEKLDLDPGFLREGDKVVLLPIEERQRYIILCRVVEV